MFAQYTIIVSKRTTIPLYHTGILAEYKIIHAKYRGEELSKYKRIL